MEATRLLDVLFVVRVLLEIRVAIRPTTLHTTSPAEPSIIANGFLLKLPAHQHKSISLPQIAKTDSASKWQFIAPLCNWFPVASLRVVPSWQAQ